MRHSINFRMKMSIVLIHFLLSFTCTRAAENLAFGRPTRQEYAFPTKPIEWGAGKAVDGEYSDRSAAGSQCTISDAGKKTATWWVDLQRVVSISYINIYYRTDNMPSTVERTGMMKATAGRHMLSGIKQLSYITDSYSRLPLQEGLTNTFLRSPGAYYDRFAGFFLYVSNTTSKYSGYLCFHEIQNETGTPTENQTISCSVYGRYVIYYNERRPDVTYPSYYSQYAYNELCELEVYGCPYQGYYGEYCNQSCPENCHNQMCNITTGNCVGCIAGYQGPKCSLVCDKHTYGLGCLSSCGNCSDGETCHHVNGTCLRGCGEGAKGEACQNECSPGYYGKGCIYECSENCGILKSCDRFTGKCEERCQPGWKGKRCDKKCDGGMYSVNCNQTCGHCKNDTQCHHINGTCIDGCSAGYNGQLCVNVCRKSYWGENCKKNCSTECVNQVCHHVTGVCESYSKSKMREPCNCDNTITIISVIVSVLIVVSGSVLNYIIWRRNQSQGTGVNTGRNRNLKELSAVNITGQRSSEDKITSTYAELGNLDKPSTYDELHVYTKADEKM